MNHLHFLIVFIFSLFIQPGLIDTKALKHPEKQFNIVFVYTVVNASCKYGLPGYIRYSLEQSIFSQPDCNTVLLSNIQHCAAIAESVKDIEGLQVVDSIPIASNRTIKFENLSDNILMSGNSLWMTSALRFFLLEDLMRDRGWHELIHFEADNMLYGRLTTILPYLRHYYPLAVTPLNIQVTFITASVLWISNLKSLIDFNDYLMNLALNTNQTHDQYIDYLRPSSTKWGGGMYPDANGNGVKPFAINEMSMLAYYHQLYPKELVLLPVVPAYPFVTNRHIPNVSEFGPMGSRVGHVMGHAIWDSGSWGQFIGGTPDKKGKNKRFTDGSHVIGIGIRVNRCQMVFWCSNLTDLDYSFHHDHHHHYRHHPHHNKLQQLHFLQRQGFPALAGNASLLLSNSSSHSNKKKGRCYTAPFVRCGENQTWTPLWNLHVHSKHTMDYKSTLCDCEREGGKGNVSIYVENDDYQWKPEKIPFEV
jgi:hypothetical protein